MKPTSLRRKTKGAVWHLSITTSTEPLLLPQLSSVRRSTPATSRYYKLSRALPLPQPSFDVARRFLTLDYKLSRALPAPTIKSVSHLLRAPALLQAQPSLSAPTTLMLAKFSWNQWAITSSVEPSLLPQQVIRDVAPALHLIANSAEPSPLPQQRSAELAYKMDIYTQLRGAFYAPV